MSEFAHPRLDDVSLDAVLHALGDPARLKMVAALALEKEALCCEGTLCSSEVPKSTRSNHLRILREAGVIRTERNGRHLLNHLRRDELDARFPGLMETLISNLIAQCTVNGRCEPTAN